MESRVSFVERINITQRQAALVVLGGYFLGTFLLVIVAMIMAVDDRMFIWGGISGTILFGGAWLLYYKRNWQPARYIAVFAATLLLGLFLEEPFISDYAPMEIAIPPILALILIEPIGVIINGLLMFAILWIRAGGNGVYAHPVTLTLYAMIVGGLVVSRLIEETTLQKLKKAQLMIRQSEDQMRALVASLDDIVVQFDAQGTYLSIWAADESLLARPRDQLLGKTIKDVLGAEHGRQFEDAIQRVTSSGHAESLEYPLDVIGGKRWFNARINPILDENGSHRTVSMLIRDITERKLAEETLRNNEQRFRELIANGLDYISLLDSEGKLLWESPANVRMLGYESNELVGKSIFELVHPDDLNETRMQFTELLTEPGNQICGIFRLRHTNGTWRWVEAVATDLLHIPSVGAIILNYRDITERKKADEYIRYQASLLKSVSDAIIATDMSSNITNWNPAAQEIYGWRADQVLGKPLNLFLQTEYEEGTSEEKVFRQFLEEGIWRGEVTQKRRDGTRIPILSSVALVRDEGNAPIATVATNRDITDRKRAENELRALNEQLEQRVEERTEELKQTNAELEHANRAKDEFLANMSHELRTPLNSILGLSESLLEQRRGSLNGFQVKSLEIIESSGRHLLELINDILDLSKIEAGKFDYYPQPVSIDEVCRSSLTFIKAQAAKKSIKVIYSNQASVSKIFADSRRLKQILVNLLSNAVKFTHENGQVALEVRTDLEQNRIRFSVVDNGVGIASKDLPKLFQPFVQVDSGLNRQYEGTGLGLALVQKLTDLHGGSVSVESEVDKGSRFTINLSCQQDLIPGAENIGPNYELGNSEDIHGPKAYTRPGVILLAEDNMPNVLTIGEYLTSYKYEVVVAHDGLEALAKADEVNLDLILMDIQMPAMNGLDAITHLRSNPRYTSIPIIALTALAMPGDRERCLQAGANEHMTKPVSLKLLVKTIERFLGRRQDISE